MAPPERRFGWRGQPRCAQHPWEAVLENELDHHPEFTSLLELAWFLANPNAEFCDDTTAPMELR